MTAPPVIVMRGNDICYLGILRSCRAAGLSTVSIEFSWPGARPWYSEYSNCREERVEIANPFSHAAQARDQLRDALQALYKRYGQKLLFLPSSDTNYMFVLDNFEHFSPFIFLIGDRAFAAPRSDVVHKASCAQLLMNGCPELAPLTLRCNKAADIDTVVEQMVFPAVYKPAVKDYGQTFYTSHNGSKAVECESADELRRGLIQEIEAGFDLVVQEKILFDSVYDEIPFYLYADASGEIRMAANGIKEVIEPFPFGTAIVLRLAWYPELLECAKQVVNALKYRGILMIEFVKDKRDDRWKVIEVNPRHWLFNGFYARQNLNYTAMLAADIAGKEFGGMVTPAENATDFAHVDLAAWASRVSNESGLSEQEFLQSLDKIEGQLSDPYFMQQDARPSEVLIDGLVNEYGWNKSIGKDIVHRLGDL